LNFFVKKFWNKKEWSLLSF